MVKSTLTLFRQNAGKWPACGHVTAFMQMHDARKAPGGGMTMNRRWMMGCALALLLTGAPLATAQNGGYAAQPRNGPQPMASGRAQTFDAEEIIRAGHRFFGTTTKGLALLVEKAFRGHGRPSAYILGEEGGGAFIAGLVYGEGWLYMRDGRRVKVFWQGPSIGFDAGGNGSRVLMLVYKLDTPRQILGRFPGVSGSAYVVAGFSMSAYGDERMTIMPIRSGIGARLGGNLGYLKFTARPTWNPF